MINLLIFFYSAFFFNLRLVLKWIPTTAAASINKENQYFTVNYALKMWLTMAMQFYATSVKHASISNVTILPIWIININKVGMSHGIASLVPIHSFHLVIWTIKIFIGNNGTITSSEINNLNSSLLLKPPPDLTLHCNQFNNAIPENRSDPENVVQSKYYDIDELQKLTIPNKENSLSLFHINFEISTSS